MRFESKLCHISDNKAIVQVTGWINEKNIGSALAEGITVEDAEDKAISRLNLRISGATNKEETLSSSQADRIKEPIKFQIPKTERKDKSSINNEPSDWSSELTSIDSEINRLKWTREDEINFLEKTMGFNNRNKITNYSDIVKYLSLLRKTDNDNMNEVITGNIYTLIEESDSILSDLSWNNLQGREYLQREFNVSTRKELNENQLILFIEQLKKIRNQNLPQ